MKAHLIPLRNWKECNLFYSESGNHSSHKKFKTLGLLIILQKKSWGQRIPNYACTLIDFWYFTAFSSGDKKYHFSRSHRVTGWRARMNDRNSQCILLKNEINKMLLELKKWVTFDFNWQSWITHFSKRYNHNIIKASDILWQLDSISWLKCLFYD